MYGLSVQDGTLFGALLVLMCLDVLTGWLASIVTGVTSSRVSWRGVTRKVLTLCGLVAVALVNLAAPAPVSGYPILSTALVGYIVTEGISIRENVSRATRRASP